MAMEIDFAGAGVGLFLERSSISRAPAGDILRDFCFHLLHQLGARLVGGHPGDALEGALLFLLRVLQLVADCVALLFARLQAAFAGVQRLDLVVEGFFFALDARFHRLQLGALLAELGFQLRADTELFFLRLERELFLLGRRLLAGRGGFRLAPA